MSPYRGNHGTGSSVVTRDGAVRNGNRNAETTFGGELKGGSDLFSSMGKSSQNMTNEPKVDKNVICHNVDDILDGTTNSGADSGFDTRGKASFGTRSRGGTGDESRHRSRAPVSW